jgi:flavin reductase (DIM6/NTAB) family NADH-FMN oxidoreductase RutF
MSRFDALQLREAFACFPSGLIAIGALHDGKPHGMVASSFTSVSLEPPLVSVCFAKTSGTWQVLRQLPRVGLSVLSEDHRAVASDLSARGNDKFVNVSWRSSEAGAVYVDDAGLWVEGSFFQIVDAGDHDVAILQIERIKGFPDVSPIVFHASSYTQLVRIEH